MFPHVTGSGKMIAIGYLKYVCVYMYNYIYTLYVKYTCNIHIYYISTRKTIYSNFKNIANCSSWNTKKCSCNSEESKKNRNWKQGKQIENE